MGHLEETYVDTVRTYKLHIKRHHPAQESNPGPSCFVCYTNTNAYELPNPHVSYVVKTTAWRKLNFAWMHELNKCVFWFQIMISTDPAWLGMVLYYHRRRPFLALTRWLRGRDALRSLPSVTVLSSITLAQTHSSSHSPDWRQEVRHCLLRASFAHICGFWIHFSKPFCRSEMATPLLLFCF